jgi:hypothetical protein
MLYVLDNLIQFFSRLAVAIADGTMRFVTKPGGWQGDAPASWIICIARDDVTSSRNWAWPRRR